MKSKKHKKLLITAVVTLCILNSMVNIYATRKLNHFLS